MQVTKTGLLFLFVVLMVGCQQTNDSTQRNTYQYKKKNFDYKIYTVSKGDTLYSVSKKYNIRIYAILIDNNLKTSKPLEIGQKLYIRSPKVAAKTYRKKVNTYQRRTYQTTKTKSIHVPTRITPRKKASIVGIKGNPPYMLIPRGTGYRKPINGKIIKRFSNYVGGRPLYGVNIRSSTSQSIRSIHNGVVVFTSESFANYGRCVMIAHSRKEKCFYYGLDKISLKVGDVINKGYQIGKIKQYKTLGLKVLRNDYFVNPQKIIPRL